MAIIAGEKIILTATYKDAEGSKTNPSKPVQVTIKAPDNSMVVEDEVATEDSIGVFSYSFVPDIEGSYEYKFVTADDSIEVADFTVEKDTVG